jgi:uncharacterized protein (DUF2141 family)
VKCSQLFFHDIPPALDASALALNGHDPHPEAVSHPTRSPQIMRRFPRLRPRLASGIAVALVSLTASAAIAADLTVTVHGATGGTEAAGGKVAVALFDSPTGFPKESASFAALRLPPDQTGRLSFTLHGLPAGTYAMAIYFDANGNGKLDTNMVGMPAEAYGFSNEARGNFGPPDFAAAALRLGDGKAETTINLVR